VTGLLDWGGGGASVDWLHCQAVVNIIMIFWVDLSEKVGNS
jgi:hypothetical protein